MRITRHNNTNGCFEEKLENTNGRIVRKSHSGQLSFVSNITEPLTLLVLRIHGTQNENFIPALDHLAVLAQATNRSPHLHCVLILSSYHSDFKPPPTVTY